MTRTRITFAWVGALVVGAGLCAGLARAEDPKEAMPPVQKEMKQPFVDGLVGTWNIESTGPMAGKGKATFAKGVGATALLEDYEGTSAMGSFSGHGIHKVSADNKTITVWWIDNYLAEPMKLTGPLTDTNYEISGEAPGMGAMKIKFEKKGDGLVFTMEAGGQTMVSNYTRAK
jgi:hypothetical protein